jgi:hypothetical protein
MATPRRSERREAEAAHGVFMAVAALIVVAVLWFAYWFDTVYRRWWKANHPFAEFSADIERLAATYRRRRANVGDAAYVMRELVAEISRALER